MKTKITIIIILFFFQICEIHSQYSIKKNIDKSEVYSYNDNVKFNIKSMREHTKGVYGYMPLRGYTSYVISVEFKNISDSETDIDLDKIYLGDILNETKTKITWFDTSLINGSRNKTTFKIKPSKSKTYFLLYIFPKNINPCFVLNNSAQEIKFK
jgi:hypothetical protein